MGSGSLAAMAIFEAGYKDNMTQEEAVALVRAAINAGIFNDLGSGGNCDVCVITKDGHTMYRGIDKKNEGAELRAKHTRPVSRIIPKGATAVLKEVFDKRVVVTSTVVEGKVSEDVDM
jgi:20S proteasome subunit beta 2